MELMQSFTPYGFPSSSSYSQEWVEIVRKQRSEPDWTPTRYSRICTLHFYPGHVKKTIKGGNMIVRGSLPFLLTPGNVEKPGETPSDGPIMNSGRDINETNLQGKMDGTENNESAEQEVVVVQSKMDETQDKVEVPDKEENMLASNNIQPVTDVPTNQPDKSQQKPKETNSSPLDKFKRRLVRAVARQIQQKKTEEEMWKELKKEIGCDCRTLWQHMRALTVKKLKRLLPVNDFLANIKKIARFTATDWLLFDLILVHEKINVINENDASNIEENNKQEPQCLYDLFELVKEHRVEELTGDDLIEAWIRITLQYNSRGRQCSPMLLQLRWYQLKELTRARFYNFWCTYRGNNRILERAMKFKPSALQTAIAREYKKIITHPYPEWEKLIEDRRVILSEEFSLNREAKKKAGKTREENDVEIEVIEPLVETIELEVDSVEENSNGDENKIAEENCDTIEENNKITTSESDENKIQPKNTLDSASSVNSESCDDVLELDGLSDAEAMHVPSENLDENNHYHMETNSSAGSGSIIKEILPKITNVIGNVVELTELLNKQEINAMEKNVTNETESAITETLHDFNRCTDIKDADVVQCDSDEEIDKILCEKAHNLMNVEITKIKSECDPDSVISATESNIKTTHTSRTNKIIICSSDDEIDKILPQGADNYKANNPSKTNVEITEQGLHVNPNISDDVIANEDPIRSVVDELSIVNEDETVTQEKHEDGFDEIEFNDDQIEFVDDGIEFVEEVNGYKKKEVDMTTEPLCDSEDENSTKIDLKLLMTPTVYTKKLDLMNIFKFIDFQYVTDKKVIECAILESKPVDKLALKDEDMSKFQEQSICGYETNGIQCDSDIVETAEEYANNRVKCTSWLLQKPKNRSYNPIQLCKNPDFNTRLKRFTAGFLSSTRNRALLMECKPLTIDLHKTFENKLIDGTMYLKSGDFKSAKSTAADKINNEPVSVLPSIIPGQSIIFASEVTNNISTLVSTKLDNSEHNLPLTSTEEKCSERRKVINLPDIDQVRHVNQSLLTAEVTPICIDSKIYNTNFGENHVKISMAESPFVQPIKFAPLTHIKNEPSESDLDNKKKSQTELCKTQYENSSSKDLMANKINDQIKNLTNQISEVDNNELSIDVETPVQKQPQIKDTASIMAKNNVQKPKAAQQVNKMKYIPRYRDKLTWSPKYPKNHIADSLLTLDTLSKILFLLNGDEDDIKHSSSKQKRVLKVIYNDQQNSSNTKQSTNGQRINQVQSTVIKRSRGFRGRTKGSINRTLQQKGDKDKINYHSCKQKKCLNKQNASQQQIINQVQTALIKSSILLSTDSANDVSQKSAKGFTVKNSQKYGASKKRTWKRIVTETNNYSGIYCCWARKKIVCINNGTYLDPSKHRCLVNQCQCCCCQELATLTIMNSSLTSYSRSSKKIPSTIVVSDDEDKNKCIKNNQEMVKVGDANIIDKNVSESSKLEINPCASNIVVTEQSDKVTIEIVIPPLSNQINTEVSLNTDSIDAGAGNILPQSNISQETLSSDISGNIQKLSDVKIDTPKKQKLCKTTVRAADDHVYNNRGKPINSKTQDFSMSQSQMPMDSTKSISNSDQETSKQIERTLFLNSSQMNKPTKTPIYLGKNKILLCSLKNSNVTTRINPCLPVVPYGVHFMMLPNGELKVSIDSNTQLDIEQLSALPGLMSAVQDQFLKSSISSKILTNNSTAEDNEDSNLTQQNIENSVESYDNPVEAVDKSTQSVNSATNNKNTLCNVQNIVLPGLSNSNLNDVGRDVPLTSNSPNKITEQITAQTETVNKELINSSEEHKVTKSPIKNQTTETQIAAGNLENVSQTTETLLTSAEPCLSTKNDACEINNVNTRKTILSDLMEMSGISAEDTGMVSDIVKPGPSISTLPPTIIPVTRTCGSGIDMLNQSSASYVPENISIAGPFSNLLLFEPITPLNHLLNYIGQIKPELNAVTSFAELKYVYVNSGQFFKLDVDSGVISEIKVLIKNKNKMSTMPQAIIDLTDDPSDSETVTCAEFQDILHDKQGNIEVKPIKLFKAIHPTILRRSGRSILKENEVIFPKKIIRINKQKRKQLLNIGNRYILVDFANEKEPKKPENPSTSHLDSSYDSSDEEPLAKKFKRIKETEKSVEETSQLFIDPPVSEEIIDVHDNLDISGDYGESSDLEMNSLDIEGVNPELHPVAFEEGSESDEDMCILGV